MHETADRNIGSSRVRIKIVGVGGAGCNAVTRMADAGLGAFELSCVNTDLQALEAIHNASRLAIGWRATGGFGSGGDPELGRRAADEDRPRIKESLGDADLIFVTAGMGGGTGTGAAPVVASLARETGALTVGVVSRPFPFEGPGRAAAAEAGIVAMADGVDTLLVVDNARLIDTLDPAVSLDDAFAEADAVLGRGVAAITDTVARTGVINVDFADVRAVMGGAGRAHMAIGHGRGEDAAVEAARDALASPLLDLDVKTATRALVNIIGGEALTLGEVNGAASAIKAAIHPDADVILGVARAPGAADDVRITLIATGLDPASRRKRKRGSRSRKPVADRIPAQAIVSEAEAVAESAQLSLASADAVRVGSNGRVAQASMAGE